MSYRALLTIKDIGSSGSDFLVFLGDLWDQAERLAEIALRAKSAKDAVEAIYGAGEIDLNPQARFFSCPEARQEWIETYADQTWEVFFLEVGDMMQGTIRGMDASGETFFFRKKNWPIETK